MYLCFCVVALLLSPERVSNYDSQLNLRMRQQQLIYFVNVIHHLHSVALILIRLFTDKISY